MIRGEQPTRGGQILSNELQTKSLKHIYCSKRSGEVIHLSGAGNTYIQFRGYDRGKLYFNILSDDGVTLSHDKKDGDFLNNNQRRET